MPAVPHLRAAQSGDRALLEGVCRLGGKLVSLSRLPFGADGGRDPRTHRGDGLDTLDIHFHVVPPQFLDEVRRGTFREAVHMERTNGRERMVQHAPPHVVLEPGGGGLLADVYDDALMLKAMDRKRLDGAVIGPSPGQFYYWAEPELGERMAGSVNDGIAAMVRARPDRFVGIGTLPMQDSERAVRELRRAVTELGLRGVEICTHIAGTDLDAPQLMPVYAEAERLGVPFFLHPQNTGDISRMQQYHLWNLAGFPLETALAASRLLLSGTFEKYPGFNIILAHGGGYLPYQVGRLDHGYTVRRELQHLPRRPSEYLGNIYCDTLTHDALSLRFLVDRMGDDHVVIGSDYPFDMGYDQPVEMVKASGLGAEREAKVLGRNLAALLKIG